MRSPEARSPRTSDSERIWAPVRAKGRSFSTLADRGEAVIGGEGWLRRDALR